MDHIVLKRKPKHKHPRVKRKIRKTIARWLAKVLSFLMFAYSILLGVEIAFNFGTGQDINRWLGHKNKAVKSKHDASKPTKKTEMVYVDTDSTGKARVVTVDVDLKNNKEKKTLVDRSILKNIDNYKGEEEYTKNSNGTISWDTPKGQDILYEGTTKPNDLPVEVNVKYYLDGKRINGRDLQGKSGKVKIVITYKNNLTELVNGKETHVPVVCMSSIVVSGNSFKNIKASPGSMIKKGRLGVVVGVAAPGIGKAVGSKAVKDAGIGDSITVTGKADNFEGQEIMTVVSTDSFSMVNKKLIKALNQDKKIRKLDVATKKVVKGTDQLAKGVSLLDSKLPALSDGTSQALAGSEKLAKGTETLSKALKQVGEGLDTLEQATNAAVKMEEYEYSELLGLSSDKAKKLDISDQYKDDTRGSLDLAQEDAQAVYDYLMLLGLDPYDEAYAGHDETDPTTGKTTHVKGYKENYADLESYLTAQIAKVAPDSETPDADKYAELTHYLDTVKMISNYESEVQSLNNYIQQQKEDAELPAGVADTTAKLADTNDLLARASSVLSGLEGSITTVYSLEFLHYGVDTDHADEVEAELERQLDLGIITEEQYEMIHKAKQKDGSYMGMHELLTKTDEGTRKLDKGVHKINKNVPSLTTGSNKLSAGLRKINKGQYQLESGVGKINKGTKTLNKGMHKYYTQGIGKIVKMYNQNLKGVSGKLKDIKTAGDMYDNYSGKTEDMSSSVTFMYFTPMGNYHISGIDDDE